MRVLSGLLIATLLLAGCTSIPNDQVFTVADDAGPEDDAYTGNGYDLRVRVVDQDGNPIQGAAVVYFIDDDSFLDIDFDAGEGADGYGADAAVYYKADFGGYDMLAGVRTDANGMVSVDVEPGLDLNVAAGDVTGMTTEVLPNINAGSGGQSGTFEVMLYPDQITWTFEVNAGNEVGRAGLQPGTAQIYPVELTDTEHFEAYQARLHAFDLAATWTNGPTSGADYYVAAGSEAEVYWEGDDEQQVPMDGENTEDLAVSVEDLYEHMGVIGRDGLYLHLATDWVSLGFSDFPVEVTIDADLKGSNIRIN